MRGTDRGVPEQNCHPPSVPSLSLALKNFTFHWTPRAWHWRRSIGALVAPRANHPPPSTPCPRCPAQLSLARPHTFQTFQLNPARPLYPTPANLTHPTHSSPSPPAQLPGFLSPSSVPFCPAEADKRKSTFRRLPCA